MLLAAGLPVLATLVVLTSRAGDWSPWWLILLLGALCAATEIVGARGVPDPRLLEVSGASVALFCAYVLLGPAPAAVLGALVAAMEGTVRGRAIDDTLSNVGNYIAFPLVGGVLAHRLLAEGPLTLAGAGVGIVLFAIAELVSFGLAYCWRYVKRPEPDFFRRYGMQFLATIPSILASAMLAVLAVFTYRTAGGVALGLLAGALLLIQVLFARLMSVEFALRAERDRAQSYLQSAGSPFVILDAEHRIEMVNRRALRLLCLSEPEAIGQRWLDFILPHDTAAFVDALAEASDESSQVEGRVTAGGRERTVLWSVARLPGPSRVTQILLSGEDITERRIAEQALERLAYQDPLTGLANRPAFATALDRACQGSECLAVLFIDLDGFKAVNDAHGHVAGDGLLCHVARRLERGVREDDLVARQSGDEFLVLLSDLPAAEDDALKLAADVLERLSHVLGAPYRVDDAEVRVAASIGLALYPRDGDGPESLISAADSEMYSAKPLATS